MACRRTFADPATIFSGFVWAGFWAFLLKEYTRLRDPRLVKVAIEGAIFVTSAVVGLLMIAYLPLAP
jgi:hypothetical protein